MSPIEEANMNALRRPKTLRRKTVLVRSALLAIVTTFVLAFVATGSAQAGTYQVRECWGDRGTVAPDAQYSSNITTTWIQGAAGGCQPAHLGGNSGGYGINVSAVKDVPACCIGKYGIIGLYAPQGTVILGGSFNYWVAWSYNWTAYIRAYDLGNTPSYPCSGDPGGNPTCYTSSVWRNGSLGGGPFRALEAVVVCSWGGGCNGSGIQAWSQMRDFNISMRDDVPPGNVSLGGELAAAGGHHGTESLTVSATDVGAGIRDAVVKVNGAEIARPVATCPEATPSYAYQFVPCPLSATLSLPAVNTENAPWRDGANLLEVCARDYANGNGLPNATCATATVVVDNSCPASVGPQATAVSGALQPPEGPARNSVRLRSNQSAVISGEIRGTGGSVAGATVCVFERLDLPGQDRTLVDTVKSHRDGSFQVPLAPGPSRAFDLLYRYNNKVVESDRLQLDSSVMPELGVNRTHLLNGKKLRFRGRLPGPYAESRVVAIQAKVGKRWVTFKDARTDGEGVFKSSYRFTRSTAPRTIYRFRARVRQQNGYPYQPGNSRRKKVVVTG